YRYTRELVRKANTTDQTIKELIDGENEYWNTENSNKNATVVTTQRDYLAGITSTDITRRFLLPEDIVKAHDEGIIHFHDADYFAQNALHNCELINLDDMLQNGTVINGVMIEKPHRFITAATIATQIILAVTSSSYGGATVSVSHLAPFARASYEKYYKKYKSRNLSEDQCKKFAKEDTRKEIEDGVQTFNYQVNSMTNTNGQAPFLSVCLYLGESDEYKEEIAMIIEEFLKQRILGFKNEKGVYITPAFPKLLYVLEEDNIHENSKYWYLTKLAAECTAKRLVPDYISEKVMKELKKNEYGEGECYPCMGCRSFLTPDRAMSLGNIAKAKNYVEGKGKYYGRFNQGVVTINLPDVALSSKQDMDKFWKIFDERLELCHRALQLRHKRLSNVTSDVAPILWQNGALARLEKGESIHELLHHGYSTISLGYAGLYECVKYMTGKSHTDNGEGKDFGLKIMEHLNDACKKWKADEDIDYSVYGTPIEATTYKFAKCLKERFGVVKGITDKNYITNSYHVPVFEEIDAFTKLKLESEFQRLSPGGAISYVETPNLQNNLDVVIELIKFIYDNIMYAELNTKSDYCQKCGYTGEILVDDNLEWYCPNCGNRDHNLLNVARRTCGYIGTNFWNKGRTQEIKERVLHIDNKTV
ncbi:MAG TPA: anaerobic ribonucleoside-triphosphate reductase, partial [Clostridiales bacterium]|nr:anaerobic ribonucleoside-triphosphate reductase [Clostridiales bacterium]